MLSEKATDSNAVTYTEPRSDVDVDTISTVCDTSISSNDGMNGEKDIETLNVKKISKKKSVRCEVCRKKIGMLVFKCKCSSELTFCSSHIQPELHECTFDHKSDALERLSSTLTKVVADKIIRI